MIRFVLNTAELKQIVASAEKGVECGSFVDGVVFDVNESRVEIKQHTSTKRISCTDLHIITDDIQQTHTLNNIFTG